MKTTGWRKSSRSNSSGNNNCVEMRLADGVLQVRDSKMGDDSPILDLTFEEFEGLKRVAQR